MINQFLKVGGVATLKDFYQKFPTQAHFDHYVQMKYGGGINAYANGGSYRRYQGDVGGSTVTAPPRRGDYMDNEEQYQADMDAYTQSLGTGPSNNAVVGKDGMTQYIRRPADDGTATAPAAAATTPAAATTAKTKLNPYSGVSIVDFLGAQGKAADFGNRKKLAEAMGISGYTGKAGENTKLLKMLQSSPELLDSYASGPTTGGGSGKPAGKKKLSKAANFYDDMLHDGETMEEMYARQAAENPYVMAPKQKDYQFGVPTFPGGPGGPAAPGTDDDGNSPWPWIAGGAGAAALGYGAYKKFGKKGAAAIQELKQLGYSEPAAMKLLGYSGGLPPAGGPTKLIGQGAGSEIANAIAQRGSYTVDELKQLMKTNPAEAQKLAAQFPKFVQGTSKAAAPAVAQQVINAGNKSNTAASTAEKVAASAPGYLETAGNWLRNAGSGAKTALKEGVTAAKEAKMVKDAMKLYKFFGKIRGLEHGGEADDLDMLHHYYKLNYLQNGGYMDDGGYMNDGEGSYAYGGHYLPHAQEGNEGDWSIGSWHVPGWLKTTAQVIDPTGISSWGDAGRAMKEAYNNPGWGSIGNAALETLGALPIIGKVGKAAKVAKVVGEGEKVSKLAKATNMITKPITAVANARVPYTKIKPFKAVEQIDNYLPFQKVTGAIPTKIVSKAPKAVQSAVELGNSAQRFKRWNKGAQGILGGIGVSGEPSTPSGSTNYSYGGSNHNNDTYYQGMSYQEGGSFVPSYGDSAYGLPQYSWGANYQEGGMAPEQMAQEGMPPQGAPQQGPPQQPSEGGGIDPQQIMQEVAQMLQQGAQPDQVMQQLVQEGVPQDVAQQIIQQVIQQLQGGQGEQQAPPQQRYGGKYAKGGISAGQEMDVTPEQMEALRQQGYKFDII